MKQTAVLVTGAILIAVAVAGCTASAAAPGADALSVWTAAASMANQWSDNATLTGLGAVASPTGATPEFIAHPRLDAMDPEPSDGRMASWLFVYDDTGQDVQYEVVITADQTATGRETDGVLLTGKNLSKPTVSSAQAAAAAAELFPNKDLDEGIAMLLVNAKQDQPGPWWVVWPQPWSQTQRVAWVHGLTGDAEKDYFFASAEELGTLPREYGETQLTLDATEPKTTVTFNFREGGHTIAALGGRIWLSAPLTTVEASVKLPNGDVIEFGPLTSTGPFLGPGEIAELPALAGKYEVKLELTEGPYADLWLDWCTDGDGGGPYFGSESCDYIDARG